MIITYNILHYNVLHKSVTHLLGRHLISLRLSHTNNSLWVSGSHFIETFDITALWILGVVLEKKDINKKQEIEWPD